MAALTEAVTTQVAATSAAQRAARPDRSTMPSRCSRRPAHLGAEGGALRGRLGRQRQRAAPATRAARRGAGRGAGEASDRAALREHVDAAEAVLPEGDRDRPSSAATSSRSSLAAGAVGFRLRSQPGAVVGVDVAAGELGHARIAHDVAARDRAGVGGIGVRVLVDRRHGVRERGQAAGAGAGPRSCASRSWCRPPCRAGAGRSPRTRRSRRRRSAGRPSRGRTRTATGCAGRAPRPPAPPPARSRAGSRARPAPCPRGSMRRILPSSRLGSCARFSGSPCRPPSPMPTYR